MTGVEATRSLSHEIGCNRVDAVPDVVNGGGGSGGPGVPDGVGGDESLTNGVGRGQTDQYEFDVNEGPEAGGTVQFSGCFVSLKEPKPRGLMHDEVDALNAMFSDLRSDSTLTHTRSSALRLMVDTGANVTMTTAPLSGGARNDTVWIRGVGGRVRCEAQGSLDVYATDTLGMQKRIQLAGVHQVDGPVSNILSASHARDAGYFTHIDYSPHMTDRDGNRYDLVEENGLFYLPVELHEEVEEEYHQYFEVNTAEGFPAITEVVDVTIEGERVANAASIDLWHSRLGHASVDRVRMIFKKGLATKTGSVVMAPRNGQEPCDVCELSKAHKVPIRRHRTGASPVAANLAAQPRAGREIPMPYRRSTRR